MSLVKKLKPPKQRGGTQVCCRATLSPACAAGTRTACQQPPCREAAQRTGSSGKPASPCLHCGMARAALLLQLGQGTDQHLLQPFPMATCTVRALGGGKRGPRCFAEHQPGPDPFALPSPQPSLHAGQRASPCTAARRCCHMALALHGHLLQELSSSSAFPRPSSC